MTLFGGDSLGNFIQDFENLVIQYDNGIQSTGTGPTAPVAAGGSYKFTPAELESILGQWKDLQANLQTAMKQSDNTINNVQPPGNETASQTAVSAANNSGNAYLDHLTAMNTYAQKYIDALQTALTNYQNAETAGHQSMQNVTTQLG